MRTILMCVRKFNAVQTVNKLYYNISKCCIILCLLLFTGCNFETPKERTERLKKEELVKLAKADSVATVKRTRDSLLIVNLKVNPLVTIGDKTLKLLASPQILSKLKYEYEETSYSNYWREIPAERGEAFLSMRIRLTSKSKAGNNPENFFPTLNLFSIDRKNNKIKPLGRLEMHLYRKSDINIVYLEQLFDYKESETFIFSKNITVPREHTLVVTATKANGKSFNPDGVLALIKL